MDKYTIDYKTSYEILRKLTYEHKKIGYEYVDSIGYEVPNHTLRVVTIDCEDFAFNDLTVEQFNELDYSLSGQAHIEKLYYLSPKMFSGKMLLTNTGWECDYAKHIFEYVDKYSVWVLIQEQDGFDDNLGRYRDSNGEIIVLDFTECNPKSLLNLCVSKIEDENLHQNKINILNRDLRKLLKIN